MGAKLTQKQIIIVAAGALLVIGVFVVLFLSARTKNTSQNYVLTIWGTDPQRTWNDLIQPYASKNSNASIKYIEVDPLQYKSKLLAALAAGTGPDIFEIGNRELAQWVPVSVPLPAQFAQQFNIVKMQSEFPDVVGRDFVYAGQIYALPLGIDTLAMVYNKDLFDSAGIALPPTTWDEFDADVSKLRQLNEQGQLTRAAAAIGGSSQSIGEATDILFLLMLQNGTQMTGRDGTTASFATAGGDSSPGLAAFNFYLQFSSPTSPYYTWNDGMGNALDSFVQGKTAVIFTYQSSVAKIKERAPFLNVGIAPMPQPKGASVTINYPKYKGLAVARTQKFSSAWAFILDLTSSEANDSMYIQGVGGAPALRTALAADINDPALSVFAAQALTARSWFELNDTTVDAAMTSAIQSVLNGSTNPVRALTTAQEAINQAR